MPEMFEQLVEAYLTQDLAGMEKLYQEYTQDNDVKLVEELTERLLNARNKLMVARMASLFAEHACFAAVGALHLPGEKGLVNKLRRAGFKITPVLLVNGENITDKKISEKIMAD
jgi:hypothetical protein